MTRVRRLWIGSVAVLVLLALVTLLMVIRQRLAAAEAADVALQPVAKLGDTVIRDRHVAIAFLALMALFAFVIWTAFRAGAGEGKATPLARESDGGCEPPGRSQDARSVKAAHGQ
jgi:hypothetical protein